MAMIAESANHLHEIGWAPETMIEHKKNKKPRGRDTINSSDKSMALEWRKVPKSRQRWSCKSSLWGTLGQKPVPNPKGCLMAVVNLSKRNRLNEDNVPGV